LISFLISKSRVANELRKRLVFKIIPMSNPDGVIIGNTRTTLIGKDMNRQFPQAQGNGLVGGASQDNDLPQVEESKLNPIPYAIRDLLL
jgi:murein tripeptide amidase MpaA